ncbi:MAG: alkaline phosphatase family protein [Bdellovibrionaceae bacterium]|nr:alkaline phosphatase family protein [Pseudobdellovibrionaceae bacterium]
MHYILLFAFLLISCQSFEKKQELTPPPPAELNPQQLPILQGATDQTSTVISVLVPKAKIYNYSFHLDKTVLRTPDPEELAFEGFAWKIVNFKLDGLYSGATYIFRINDNNKIIEERRFKTLPKDLKLPKVAVISCTDDSYDELQKKQWELVEKQKPDMLFLIGDNVYVDLKKNGQPPLVNEQLIWQRYQETRLHLDLYKMKNLIPTFSTWDDHDYGSNNADRNFAYKNQSKRIFENFFPTKESVNIERGPGVSSFVQIGKNNFVLFDDRYFRSESNKTPGDTHFGAEQEQWFFSLLKKKKGLFWLISGDQFFGGHHTFESYQGNHPKSFEHFLQKIKQSKKMVLFISGDRHIAELMRIPKKYLGFTTYELTSSGLHAHMYPGSLKDTPNPLAIYNKDGEANFLLVQPHNISNRQATMGIQFLGANGRRLYSSELEVRR